MKGIPNGWSIWGVRPEIIGALRAHLPAAMGVDGDISAADTTALPLRAQAEDEGSAGGVAILSLRGLITPNPSLLSILFGGGGGGLQAFRAQLRSAVGNDNIEAIVLNIDSPGGSVKLLPETAAEIREARDKKPVVAVANTLAASAAYYLGAQANEFVVTPSGEAGSIGTIAIHWDDSKFFEEMGSKPTIIAAGKFKAEANPYEPLSEEARQMLQGIVDDYYEQFVQDVALGRGVSADAVRNGFGEGRCLTAKNAVAAGLADRVESIEQTISRLVDAGGSSASASVPAPEPTQAVRTSEAEITGGSPRAADDDEDLESPGTPAPNSDEEKHSEPDEEAQARTRRIAIDALLAP